MSDAATARVSTACVRELLAQSLIAWRAAGHVSTRDDSVVVESPDGDIVVERASPGTPFRWMVSVRGRRRPAVSLVAVLRQVREALDPNHTGIRVRIAVAPLVPE